MARARRSPLEIVQGLDRKAIISVEPHKCAEFSVVQNGYPCDGLDDATATLGLTFRTNVFGIDQAKDISNLHRITSDR